MDKNNLIKKYKEELLGDPDRKVIIDKTRGNLQDQVDLGLKTRERNDEELEQAKKAAEVVKDFVKQTWNEDRDIRKEFPNSDDWNDALMDELKLPYPDYE